MWCEILLVALNIALPTAIAAWCWTAASASAEARAAKASPATTRRKVPTEATTTTRAAETTSRSNVATWTGWRSSGCCRIQGDGVLLGMKRTRVVVLMGLWY